MQIIKIKNISKMSLILFFMILNSMLISMQMNQILDIIPLEINFKIIHELIDSVIKDNISKNNISEDNNIKIYLEVIKEIISQISKLKAINHSYYNFIECYIKNERNSLKKILNFYNININDILLELVSQRISLDNETRLVIIDSIVNILGADVSAISKDENKSVLMYAAANGYIQIVRFLINSGVDVNFKCNNNPFTALMYATSNGHHDIVELLLNKGAGIGYLNT